MAATSVARSRSARSGGRLARALEVANLTPSGAAVLVLIVIGWLGARVMGGRTMYLMVYAGLLAVALAWIASRRRLAIDVERDGAPMRMRVDQVLPVTLRLRARGRVSTIVVEERLHPRLGPPVIVPIGSLRPGTELEHRYSLTPTTRGVYELGPLVATWSDPFGFTTHRQVLSAPVEVIVHPTVEPVHDRVLTRMWEDPPIRPPVSKPWPVGFEFYGLREYVPGDDLRRVVWAVLARTRKLMVRESEQGITDRVVLHIDTGREHHSPGEVSATFETAVRVAASVGARHLADGFAVTVLTNEGRLLRSLRGSRAHLEYLDALARLQMDDKPKSAVGHLLLEEAKARPHLFVITPHLDAQDAQRLKIVVDRGVSTTVAVVMTDESDRDSLTRAAALGCNVVQVPQGLSLEAVFAHQVAGAVKR